MSFDGAQNLIEAFDVLHGLANGRLSRSHILPAGPFARVDGLNFDFVRAAPDEALSSEAIRAIMRQYGGRPANREDFEKLLEQERPRIIEMASRHRLNFILLGERAKKGSTVAGTYAGQSVLCFGWQEIRHLIRDPGADFFEEDPGASWDSSCLALYVY